MKTRSIWLICLAVISVCFLASRCHGQQAVNLPLPNFFGLLHGQQVRNVTNAVPKELLLPKTRLRPSGDQIKGSEKQLRLAFRAVPVTRPQTVLLAWDDPINPAGTTYNVYSAISLTVPMTLLTNTPVKSVTLPANKDREFFGIRARSVDGVLSDWATK